MNRPEDRSQILAGVPGFSDARVLDELSDGPTNNSYKVEQGGKQYVLRIDKPAATELGRDRVAEKQVCEIIAGAGLGPPFDFFDPLAGVFVRPFLAGRAWILEDLQHPENLERLAALMRQLHSLPAPSKRFEPIAAARRYAEQLGTTGAKTLYRAVEQAHARLPSFTPVLCHNDLVCQNILEAEPLVLIDWEYAAAGDPYFDLAVVVEHHQLSDGLSQHFFEAYLGISSDASQREHLSAQCKFYGALLDLWNLRVGAASAAIRV